MPKYKARYRRHKGRSKMVPLKQKVNKLAKVVKEGLPPWNHLTVSLATGVDVYEGGTATTNFLSYNMCPLTVSTAVFGEEATSYRCKIHKIRLTGISSMSTTLASITGLNAVTFRVMIVRLPDASSTVRLSPNGADRSLALLYPASPANHQNVILSGYNPELVDQRRGNRGGMYKVIYDKKFTLDPSGNMEHYFSHEFKVPANEICQFSRTAGNTWQFDANIYYVFITSDKTLVNGVTIPNTNTSLMTELWYSSAV